VNGEIEVDRSGLPPDLAALNDAELSQEAMATLDRANKALEDGDPVTYRIEMDRLGLILDALSGDNLEASPVATPGN
jgi:hypothetical protein